jgi:hypothetical protein
MSATAIPQNSTATDTPQEQCSKIFEPSGKCTNPLDTEGSPKWCKSCRAKYRREYEALKAGMNQTRGFARGAEAMRKMLSGEFERHGSGGFSGYEIAAMIEACPLPKAE